MSSRRWTTWLIFWSSVAIALGALAWVSAEVVSLERREIQASLNAQREDSIRRALWRMDSFMSPILAIEASRPQSDYKDLENERTRWLADGAITSAPKDDSLTNFAYANRYFQTDQLSIESSESEPVIPGIEVAIDLLSKDKQVDPKDDRLDFAARKRVADLATQNKSEVQDRAEDIQPQSVGAFEQLNDKTKRNQEIRSTDQLDQQDGQIPVLTQLNEMQSQEELFADEDQTPTFDEYLGRMNSSSNSNTIGSLAPEWIKGQDGELQLVLVRSAHINNSPIVQGVWLDWETLQNDLLDSIEDITPGAMLVPIADSSSSIQHGYLLATLPVELVLQSSSSPIIWTWSPAKFGLLVTWIAIVSTIIAIGLVLRAAILLSDRRGHFVSAVTHELRTPLTTFRLYSQMLADGMVRDEKVKDEYLGILKRESERLSGIVENVLEYARLTRQRSSSKGSGVQSISPGELIARVRPAMARRASQNNLDLVVSLDLEHDPAQTLTVDPQAVERIMMNLIENACKYAIPFDQDNTKENDEFDSRVHLDATISNGYLELLVADHGPGISQNDSAKIFGEFRRGRLGLTNARSGIGLGLALSRGLAREMEGDLVLTKRRMHGAEFLLTIPLDPIQV